jgi:hypothetical protein
MLDYSVGLFVDPSRWCALALPTLQNLHGLLFFRLLYLGYLFVVRTKDETAVSNILLSNRKRTVRAFHICAVLTSRSVQLSWKKGKVHP